MSAQTESRQVRAKALMRQLHDFMCDLNPYDLSEDDGEALRVVLTQLWATLGAVSLMQTDIMAQAAQAIQKFREHMNEASGDKPQGPTR